MTGYTAKIWELKVKWLQCGRPAWKKWGLL